jgi:hypothetical protein
MHQAGPLYPQLLTYRCGAANRRFGPQGDIGLAYSITSSAVARSEGEIVPLFQKRLSFKAPRDGGGYQTFGALDGRIPAGLRVVPTSHSLD